MDRNDEDGDREERTDARGPEDAASPARGQARDWTVRRTEPNVRLLLVLGVAIVLVVFAALNFRPVRVNFLLFTTRARVVTVIAVAAVLGFVVGWFVGRPRRAERRHLREWRAKPARDAER